MTKEEELLRKKENTKLSIIKEAFKQNTVYKRMVRALSIVSDITINVDELAEAYMNLSSGSNNLNNQDFYTVDEGFLLMVLGGVKYEIAKEDKRIVFKNGEIDIEATIRQQMMGEYKFVENSEHLSSEDIAKLSETLDDIFNNKPEPNMDKRAESLWISTGLTIEEQVQRLTTLNESKEVKETAKRDIDLTFLRTADDVKTMNLLFEYRRELNAEQLNPRKLRRLEKKIERIPGNERYISQNGDFNRELAIEHAETYQRNYVNKKSLKNLQEVISSNIDYEKLDNDEKEILLQSIYFIAKKDNETDRTLAIEMLRLIKPEAIRDFANGDKTEIIDEEFVKAYNEINPERPNLSMEEKKKEFEANGLEMTEDKLTRLAKDVRRGTFEEMEQINENEDLDGKVKLIEELKERNKDANEFRTYKREYRILKRMIRRHSYSETEKKEMILGALGKAVSMGKKSEEAILRQYAIRELGIDKTEIQKGLQETSNYKVYRENDNTNKALGLTTIIVDRHIRQKNSESADRNRTQNKLQIVNITDTIKEIADSMNNRSVRAVASIFSTPFLMLKSNKTKWLEPAVVPMNDDNEDKFAKHNTLVQQNNQWIVPPDQLDGQGKYRTWKEQSNKQTELINKGSDIIVQDDEPQR